MVWTTLYGIVFVPQCPNIVYRSNEVRTPEPLFAFEKWKGYFCRRDIHESAVLKSRVSLKFVPNLALEVKLHAVLFHDFCRICSQ